MKQTKSTKPKGNHVPATGVKATAGKGFVKGHGTKAFKTSLPHRKFNNPN